MYKQLQDMQSNLVQSTPSFKENIKIVFEKEEKGDQTQKSGDHISVLKVQVRDLQKTLSQKDDLVSKLRHWFIEVA